MQKSSIKIIFFGTPDFVVPILETLAVKYEVAAVITAPDKPLGRKQILSPPPVKLAAKKLGLKILQFSSLKIENLKLEIPDADIGVVAAYGKIIPPELLNIPKLGLLNIHPSLLPKYRGPSPVQTTLLKGDAETGVTIIKIDAEMDHGPVLANEKTTIGPDEKFEELNNRLWKMGAGLLIKILPDYLADKIEPQPQDESKATYTHKFITEDGEIKPGDTAETAYNKIRALNPEPGAYMRFNDNNKKWHLKILDAELNSGRLELKRVHLEGGKPMTLKEFLIGHPNFKDSLLQ